jgi:hypothetical protein
MAGRAIQIDITNIRSSDQLMSYALTAQLERLVLETGLSRARIAPLLDKSPSGLCRALRKPTQMDPARFDETAAVLAPRLARTGGLSAHAVRLRRLGDRAALPVKLPPSWAEEVMEKPAEDEFGILTHASTLLQMFMAAKAPLQIERVAGLYEGELQEAVRGLIIIGASPPTPRNVEALILLGGLSGKAFSHVKDSLSEALHQNPFGFRVWRAVTTVLVANQDTPQPQMYADWVRIQLEDAEELRKQSLFPARSLDLEAALAIPPGWVPSEQDWVHEVLTSRIENHDATVRERGTAALGLWERALKPEYESSREDVKKYLRGVIEDFRAEEPEEPEEDGIRLGFRWIASTLEDLLDRDCPVSNTWPNNVCRRVVLDASDYLLTDEAGVPQRVRKGTATLFQHAVLQNAGVHRRHAIDTLLAGSWTSPVAEALARVLRDERSHTWLRCRALFAVSFLQDTSEGVELILEKACQRAKSAVDEASAPNRSVASEMHAALFAVGDCFGVPGEGPKNRARSLRDALAPTIEDLLLRSRQAREQNPELDTNPYDRVARAAAYLITVTANADPQASFDLLKGLQDHPDPATSRLGKWALRNRFDNEGRVRPLYTASVTVSERNDAH